MQNKVQKYENNPDFLEFLNREFDKTAVHATIEKLAEFAFGSVEATIEAFEEKIKNESWNNHKPLDRYFSWAGSRVPRAAIGKPFC